MNHEKWKQIKWNELWYRLIYSLLLFGMVLFAAGNICGIQKPGLLHLLVGFAVLGVLLLYELLQCVWIAVFSYAVQVFFERFPAVRYLAGILLGFVLIYWLFRHFSITHMGTTLILWYEMLNYVEWTKSRWKKEKSRDTKSYMLWIMPFCILYLLSKKTELWNQIPAFFFTAES